MTIRYFYTDALAAAWMAKHFGMKIAPDPREFPNAVNASFDANGVLQQACLAEMGTPKWRKWYIHPDSLHLLEPQVEDLVTINGGESANIATHPEFCEALKANADRFVAPVKILQRNNTAFMWPEREND